MSHGHDVYDSQEARWYYCVTGPKFTDHIYCYAVSEEDAKAAWPRIIDVAKACGVPAGHDFIVTAAAQATRRIDA